MLSAEHAFDGGIDLRIEAYRKNYRSLRPRFENLLNTMVVLPELKPDRIRIAPDGAVARGVELSLNRMSGRPLFWWASYAWSKVEDRFGGLYRAFQYGAPPHGGMAAGVDRIVMLLTGAKNLREITMFPMNQQAQDLLMNAPAEASPAQLRELHLRTVVSKKDE